MRGILFALLAVACSAAFADEVCIGGRCPVRRVIVHQNVTVAPQAVASDGTVSVLVSAQEHADTLAATGTFVHCGRRGGGYEGLGFSTAGPDAACRRACYWGQRRVREIGTAWCPKRRGWVAVVRYE